MLINQTRIQITDITLDNCWPNSSSFFCSGVFTSSSWSFIAVLILPMAVFKPVPTTTPRALPEATFVPCVYYVHHLRMCKYKHTQILIHASMHTQCVSHTHTRTYACTHACAHTHVHTYTHTQMHAYIHIYMGVHTYIP